MSWTIQGGELIDGITVAVTYVEGSAQRTVTWGKNSGESASVFKTRVISAAKEHLVRLNQTPTKVLILAAEFD